MPSLEAGPPPVIDAGAFDSGTLPACPPTTIDFSCTDTGTGMVPVGVPYELPIGLGGTDECFCGEQLECVATIEGPGRLALRTVMCSELLCDGCFHYLRGSCWLPPLSEGTWHVTVNDEDATDLVVSDATPGAGPVDRCLSTSEAPSTCPVTWGSFAEPVDQICVPTRAPAWTPIPIDVTDFCLACGNAWGSCDTVVTANEVRVFPRSLPPECDIDCPERCTLGETRCFVPPLADGVYTVQIDGLPGVAVVMVGESPLPSSSLTCLSLPED